MYGFFGMVLFSKAVDVAGQRDDAVLDFNADVRGVDRRFPFKFGQNILLQLQISFYDR